MHVELCRSLEGLYETMKGECRHNKVISQLGPVFPRMQSLVLESTTHYTGPGSRQSSPTNLTRLSYAPNLLAP